MDDKGKPQYLSGIPSLASWPKFTKLLIDRGMSPDLLEDMAGNNVMRIFNIQIERNNYASHYAFDAYRDLK